MQNEWRACKLGDVVELKRGYDLPQQSRRAGRVPVVSSSGISGTHAEAMSKPPGVVTGRYGTLGQVFYLTEEFWPLNTTLYVRDFKGNDAHFVSYFLRSVDFYACSDKAAVPGVNRNHLHELPALLPPLPEQRAIAAVLGALDDKIDLNRRMNETLEETARALFKSWFVDFDPVRAKAEGRKPFGMDAATAALFPDGFEDSELGEVPRGWRVEPLNNLMRLDKGLSYKGEFLVDSGAPMINLGCFGGEGRFLPERVKGYAGESRSQHWVREGDLVLANTDMTQNRVILGSPALVPPLGAHERALFSHHVYAARLHQDDAPMRLYLYFTLLQPEFRRRAAGFATGTTVLALPRDAVLSLDTVFPPLPLLKAFASFVQPLRQRALAAGRESKELEKLRDYLLPKLLSGEVRVAHVTEAA